MDKFSQITEKIGVVGVVGPCAAGKTTLVNALELLGFRARHIAQEHSYVADMWHRLTNPDILIYLDVSYHQAMIRRPQSCTRADYEEQRKRLIHAHQHADLYIHTDPLAPDAILTAVLAFFQRQAS